MLYHIVAFAAYHIHISIWSNDDMWLTPRSKDCKYCKKEHVLNDPSSLAGSEQAEYTSQMLGIVRQSLSLLKCHQVCTTMQHLWGQHPAPLQGKGTLMEPDGHDALVGKGMFDSTDGFSSFSLPFHYSACLFMAFPVIHFTFGKQTYCIYVSQKITANLIGPVSAMLQYWISQDLTKKIPDQAPAAQLHIIGAVRYLHHWCVDMWVRHIFVMIICAIFHWWNMIQAICWYFHGQIVEVSVLRVAGCAQCSAAHPWEATGSCAEAPQFSWGPGLWHCSKWHLKVSLHIDKIRHDDKDYNNK